MSRLYKQKLAVIVYIGGKESPKVGTSLGSGNSGAVGIEL